MLQNISNLYSGAAQVVDVKPYVNFAINQMARQQAKDEALDKYFQEQATKVTSTGMRLQDQEALVAAKNDLQSFYIKNKKDIQRGGKSYGDYVEKLNILQNIPVESKAAAEGIKAYGNTFYGKDRDNLKQVSLDAYARHEQPIYKVVSGKLQRNDFDPQTNPTGFTSLKGADIQFKPTFDFDKYNQNFGKGVKPSQTPEIRKIEGQPYKQTEVIIKKFDDKSIKELVDEAKYDFANTPKLSATFEYLHPINTWFDESGKVKPEHATEYLELNTIYKRAYPKDDINTLDELHAAMMVKQKLSEEGEDIKIADNKDAIDTRNFNQQKEIQTRGFLNTRKNMEFAIRNRVQRATDSGSAEDDLLGLYEGNFGEEVVMTDAADGKKTEATVVDVAKISPKHYELITNKLGVEPFTRATRKGDKKYFQVDKETGDWIGKDNQRIDKNEVATTFSKWKTKRLERNPSLNTGGKKTNTTKQKSAAEIMREAANKK